MLISLAAGAVLLLAPRAPALAATICIDPGHGGSDPGAVGCGLEEADVNLDTALRLQALLHAASHTVMSTRDDDTYVGLIDRAEYANAQGADRFVSLHSNSASNPAATGIETYCASNGADAAFDLRDKIQEEMVLTWPLADRGGKTASFTVLTATDMPATLSELGFIVNCGEDALYLGDPDQRQAAAEAHLRAIELHLSAEPPPVTTGEVRGVVFEEQGSGTDDMSVRLTGARVEVLQTGDEVEAADALAEWSFALTPATYTFRATHAGHQPGERSCEASRGEITWCSIGLDPASPDAGFADVGSTDVGSRDAGPVDADPPEVSGLDAGFDAETAAPDQDGDQLGGCECGAARAPAAICALLLLALGALRRGRRSVVLTLALCVLGVAAEAAPGPRLVEERRVLEGPVLGPVIAPSGQQVVFSGRGYRGLSLLVVETGEVRELSEQPRAGLWPRWRKDSGALWLRHPRRPFDAAPWRQIDLRGRALDAESPRGGARVSARADSIFLNVADRELEIAGPAQGDRFYAPQRSADGAWVVYSGLSTGLHLYRVRDGGRFALGAGHHARFGGGALVFDRTSDDGHRLLGGDLFLVELDAPSPRPVQLTRTTARIELYPSLSEDGARIAYTVDGDLYLARLERALTAPRVTP